MSDQIRQIGWSNFRHDMSFSRTPARVYKRFVIFQLTYGFIVIDRMDDDRTTTHTLAAARAWAGVRVNEHDIRHSAR